MKDSTMHCPDCGRDRPASAADVRRYGGTRRCQSCGNRAAAAARPARPAPLPVKPNRPVAHPPRPLCLHCARRTQHRSGGLCIPCHKTPDVRALYPTSPYGNRSGGDNPRGTLPDTPTDAPIGSKARVEAMARRARMKLSLFHPGDSREIRPELLGAFEGQQYSPTQEDAA